MKKSPIKKHAAITRAEYIKVEPLVSLHITEAGEGWSI